jgi:hypothetical protein
LFFEDAKCPAPEKKAILGCLKTRHFVSFLDLFRLFTFGKTAKFVGFYPVLPLAQFLVVYGYLGTFGVN